MKGSAAMGAVHGMDLAGSQFFRVRAPPCGAASVRAEFFRFGFRRARKLRPAMGAEPGLSFNFAKPLAAAIGLYRIDGYIKGGGDCRAAFAFAPQTRYLLFLRIGHADSSSEKNMGRPN